MPRNRPTMRVRKPPKTDYKLFAGDGSELLLTRCTLGSVQLMVVDPPYVRLWLRLVDACRAFRW